MNKKCIKCKQIKGLEEFYKKVDSKDGFHHKCKACLRGYQAKYERKHVKRRARYYRRHKVEAANRYVKWCQANRGKRTASVRKYQVSKINRTPRWVTKKELLEIEDFYVRAAKLSRLTGTDIQVDHIVPLQGEKVSGLHVPWNLQIISKSDNCSKSNKY